MRPTSAGSRIDPSQYWIGWIFNLKIWPLVTVKFSFWAWKRINIEKCCNNVRFQLFLFLLQLTSTRRFIGAWSLWRTFDIFGIFVRWWANFSMWRFCICFWLGVLVIVRSFRPAGRVVRGRRQIHLQLFRRNVLSGNLFDERRQMRWQLHPGEVVLRRQKSPGVDTVEDPLRLEVAARYDSRLGELRAAIHNLVGDPVVGLLVRGARSDTAVPRDFAAARPNDKRQMLAVDFPLQKESDLAKQVLQSSRLLLLCPLSVDLWSVARRKVVRVHVVKFQLASQWKGQSGNAVLHCQINVIRILQRAQSINQSINQTFLYCQLVTSKSQVLDDGN